MGHQYSGLLILLQRKTSKPHITKRVISFIFPSENNRSSVALMNIFDNHPVNAFIDVALHSNASTILPPTFSRVPYMLFIKFVFLVKSY